jgi:hypothetical protein
MRWSLLFWSIAIHTSAAEGPRIQAFDESLFQDSFSQAGGTSVVTMLDRDQLDVRIDMARDVNSGPLFNVPGDSMVVQVAAGLSAPMSDPLAQIRLHFSLNLNPTFELPIRANVLVGTLSLGTGLHGWDQVEGTIAAQQVVDSLGNLVPDHYFFDLPDQDFMYPGDVLEFHVSAEDDLFNTTTLPADLSGYDDPESPYDRRFTMRALPTYFDALGTQPVVLWIHDQGHGDAESAFVHAMGQAGYFEGEHYDSYVVRAAELPISNGIGSIGAHGASPEQLTGYNRVLYLSGNLPHPISDGSNDGINDKSQDTYTLLAWHDQPASRCIAYFGDDIAESLAGGSAAQNAYLVNTMGVQFFDGDVRDEIGGQSAPHVLATGAVAPFTQDFVAHGGPPPTYRDFDSIRQVPGALNAFGFEQVGSPGAIYPFISAAVYFERPVAGGWLKIDMTFPYGFETIGSYVVKTSHTQSPGSEIVFGFIGHLGPPPPPPDSAPPVSTPPAVARIQLDAAPNPFNPRTVLKLRMDAAGEAWLAIYDGRGRRVRTLWRAQLAAGEHGVVWQGDDDAGRPVASGNYFAIARSGDASARLTLTLVR